ncbi:prostaglandin D2 receptor-like [Mercenaria mercenaria]|uniref:prostaglandin D2 receptor-like n=1 Tax=Mercenaria mercenaria TaxID=6596 RepID=UPI00234E851B|nr:prostaglandin D2 receptor-like [Mercenaria mercenaria]
MENTTTQNVTGNFLNSSDTLNGTGSRGPTHSSQASFYVSLVLIWIPGFFTNLLALFFIIRDIKKAIFPAIVLLLVLCTSDLIATCFSFTHSMLKMFVPGFDYDKCASLSILHAFFKLYSGVMNVLMAVDRVMAICTPFYYKRHVSVNTWKVGSLIAAAAVATLNLFPLMGLGSFTGIRNTGEIYCTSVGYKAKWIERVYGFAFSLAGIICIFAIVGLNAVLIRALLRLSSKVVSFVPSETTISTTGNDSNSSKANQTSFEIAFAKLMLGLATVYLVCDTPYNVLFFLQQFNITLEQGVAGYIHLLAGFSYTCDPMVYILIRKTKRSRLKDLCCNRNGSNVTTN